MLEYFTNAVDHDMDCVYFAKNHNPKPYKKVGKIDFGIALISYSLYNVVGGILMKIEKVSGFQRVYQVESFPSDVEDMFKKNKGQRKRYLLWLYTWLTILDDQGFDALALQQFEYLKDTDNPRLYALRHPHSQINERYIFVYIDDEAAVLLTAFKEKDTDDYTTAIARAKRIYSELEAD